MKVYLTAQSPKEIRIMEARTVSNEQTFRRKPFKRNCPTNQKQSKKQL
jgi:hypothetical protein